MNYVNFFQLSFALLLLPFFTIQAQHSNEFTENSKVVSTLLNTAQNNTELADEGIISSLKSGRFMMSFDGGISHTHLGFQRMLKNRSITYQFGYRASEKTMFGIGLQLVDVDDQLQILDNNGLGTKTNNLNKKQIEPFIRRYFRKLNNFQLYSQAGVELSFEDFYEYRNYNNSEDLYTDNEFNYITYGANLGLGIEFSIKDDFAIYTYWDGMHFGRDLNQEESSNSNIKYEYNFDTNSFKELRFGVKMYF